LTRPSRLLYSCAVSKTAGRSAPATPRTFAGSGSVLRPADSRLSDILRAKRITKRYTIRSHFKQHAERGYGDSVTQGQTVRAFLGLGSNLGDRTGRLYAARMRLAGLADAVLVQSSPLYETAPWGDPDQPDYLNQVVALDLGPTWTPTALLAAVGAIETAEGRTRDPRRRFGPRTLDVDILLYGTSPPGKPLAGHSASAAARSGICPDSPGGYRA